MNPVLTSSAIYFAYIFIEKSIFFLAIYFMSFYLAEDSFSHLVLYWGGVQFLVALIGSPLNVLGINGSLQKFSYLDLTSKLFLTFIFVVSYFLLFIFGENVRYYELAPLFALPLIVKSYAMGRTFRLRPPVLIALSFIKLMVAVILAITLEFDSIDFVTILLCMVLIGSLDVPVIWLLTRRLDPAVHQGYQQDKVPLFETMASTLTVQWAQIFILKLILNNYPNFSAAAAMAFQARSMSLTIASALSSGIIRHFTEKTSVPGLKGIWKLIALSFLSGVFALVAAILMHRFNSNIAIYDVLDYYLMTGYASILFFTSIINSMLFGRRKFRESARFSISLACISLVPFFLDLSLTITLLLSFSGLAAVALISILRIFIYEAV